jgi:hypothetical protein
MSSEEGNVKPVVRLTRWSVAYSDIGRGKRQRAEASRWTIYGIDAVGVERVYVEHTTKAEHDAWRAADPLWEEAQRALFAKLLADPRRTILCCRSKSRLRSTRVTPGWRSSWRDIFRPRHGPGLQKAKATSADRVMGPSLLMGPSGCRKKGER